jgi:hypothetical protein
MILRWMLDGVDVTESVFMPGKKLSMEALRLMQAPDHLQIYQAYSSALRQVLSHIGIPENRLGPVVPAVEFPPTGWKSDGFWRLPEVRGLRKSAAYVFAADGDWERRSGPVYSSRVGKATLKLGGHIDVLAIPTPIPIGVGGQGTIEAELHFAADPELEVRILTGAELRRHMVETLESDVADYDDPERSDVNARIQIALDGDLPGILDASYTPPSDWQVAAGGVLTDTERLTVFGDAGEQSHLDLSLELPSAGTGYYAVSYTVAGSDEIGETTDAWAVIVDDELNVSVQPEPEHMRLRDFAFG